MASLTLVVEPRGKPIKKLPKTVQVTSDASTGEIYTKLAEVSGFSIHRLRITKGSDRTVVPNTKDATVDGTGLRDQSVLHVKDLGPQLGWRTVYIIEYLGPLFIPALFLFPLRPFIYFNFAQPLPDPSFFQLLVCALLTLHFVKREYETIFVHRFSNATMPARNIIKNSGHYWVLAGLNIAYWVFRPDSPAVSTQDSFLLYSGLALYIIGELANLNAHMILRDLRRPGTTERGIPAGLGFKVVTCPNYFFEIVAWVGIYLLSGMSWSVMLFIVVGSAQMAIWAKKKERRYRKEFGDKYKRKRFVLLPGIY
ncbi:steroid alpha reductase family protein [Aspergillus heteromorphus CBS 117.55]|uniref:very-long-chain enoyl-CoA reductase n=1 Tax=Aspergillus heteromorphus CBS 117.55 TaxID=1448321 RepID=A0A317WMY9_9EURO|nr:steroid alpha reductase family protein [Aspergillus heteromorphus CBS 117.55]PWY87653.1 steroid alpha reductase family protein [Aspergillus heteromorphus CBS 117.55]